MIPEFECLPSCTACCGHIAWSRFEWFCLKPEKRAEYDFFRLGCDFVKNGGCSVYQKRPFMCRIFGTVEGKTMRCPRGVTAENKLSVEQARKITRLYYKVFFKED